MLSTFSTAMSLLLLATGGYFTLASGFFQFTHIGSIIKNTLGGLFSGKREHKKGTLTPYQALATALGGSIGTANIAGVGGAIMIGGPGAIFWMWVSGFLGMMTKFAEIVLAMRYRSKNDRGEWSGGAMQYMVKGMGAQYKPLASAFALFCVLAAFCGGGMVQSNTIAESVLTACETIPGLYYNDNTVRIIIGAVLAILCAVVIFGGLNRIGMAASMLVPFAGAMYVIAAVWVIAANVEGLGEAFKSIFEGAFGGFRPAAGGVVGFALARTMRVGVARGVFSNEAGVGSAPMAHASSNTNDPVKQGMFGIIEVFTDTILICTLTALAMLCSGVEIAYGSVSVSGMELARHTFATIMPDSMAGLFLSVSIFLFAFTSIIGWSLYGSRCAEFLFGSRGLFPYRIILAACVGAGTLIPIDMVWELGELFNLLMAACNIIALLALSELVVRSTKFYGQIGRRWTFGRNK